MKTHLNLATKDIDASVRFYSTLLDIAPAKVRDDYALFITDEPGLELALDVDDHVPPTDAIHFGIVVDSVELVDAAIARLDKSGLVEAVDRDDVCCYAKQTKVWTSDPDGRRWEVYTVLEETEERSGAEMTCCA